MKTVFAILMVAAGFAYSFIKIKEGKELVKRAGFRCETASLIEERIRYTRSPLFEILSDEELSRFVSDDDECGKLIELISSSEYSSALSYAQILKNHTEKDLQRISRQEEKTREAKLFLPPAASLLVVILLI